MFYILLYFSDVLRWFGSQIYIQTIIYFFKLNDYDAVLHILFPWTIVKYRDAFIAFIFMSWYNEMISGIFTKLTCTHEKMKDE